MLSVASVLRKRRPRETRVETSSTDGHVSTGARAPTVVKEVFRAASLLPSYAALPAYVDPRAELEQFPVSPVSELPARY